jgi:hypothetical protein
MKRSKAKMTATRSLGWTKQIPESFRPGKEKGMYMEAVGLEHVAGDGQVLSGMKHLQVSWSLCQ